MEIVDKNLRALPGARPVAAFLAATSLAGALATAGQAWSLASAVVGLWEGRGLAAVAGWTAGFLACFALRQVLAAVRAGRLDRYARERARELRAALLGRVLGEGPSFVRGRGTAGVATAEVEGVDQVRSYVALVPPKVADLLVVPPVLVCALFALDWASGLAALAVLPCAAGFMGLLGSAAKEGAARRQGEYRRMANHFVDTLRGIGTLKLFGRTREQGERVFETSERFREATVATLRTVTLSSLVLDLWATFALAAVAIMLGFRLLDGSVAFLPALAALVVVPECFGALRRYAADFHATLDGRNALASVLEMLGGGGGTGAPAEAAPAGTAPAHPWSPSSTLALRGAGYAYGDEGGAWALRGVDLELHGCERVGVLGASGSGKSTLASLLAGFADPVEGYVELDGERLAGLRGTGWPRQVTYIPQNPHIFSATLRDNIAFYRPDATDAEVRRAVGAVGLDGLVAELPRGLATPVGEGGRALSGGQAQRVALARAFLGDRRVLVFDEPTAHLDVETELALKECMLPLMEGRLVLFATHRLHWVRDMDRVVVLEGGRVAEVGTPGELLARPEGALARLAARQKGGVAL